LRRTCASGDAPWGQRVRDRYCAGAGSVWPAASPAPQSVASRPDSAGGPPSPRSSLGRPELWLLDEPHAGLDAEGRDLIDELLRTAAAAGATVVVASHERERAAGLAQRASAVDGGLVFESGPRAAVAPTVAPANRGPAGEPLPPAAPAIEPAGVVPC
jgi:hypothetical protein